MIKMTKEQVEEAILLWAHKYGHAVDLDVEIQFDIIERRAFGDVFSRPEYELLGVMFDVE